MTQANSSDNQKRNRNATEESTQFLKDFLEQKKENELGKLLEEAYEYVVKRDSDVKKQLNFLLDVCCFAFRESWSKIDGGEIPAETPLSESFVKILSDFCAEKNLNLVRGDQNNLKRRLDIERHTQLDHLCPIKVPFQILAEGERGLSSLGNLKKTKALIQTQFDISDQITNEHLSSISSSDVCKTHSGQKDVFVGTLEETGRKVAVKTSRGGRKNDATTIREAEIQSSIAHQGVPTIISLNKEEIPVIVETFIEGQDWASIIDSQTREEQINTLLQVGEIMAYVHKKSKVVHGDLKPENVRIGDYGEVYVIDWGMAIKLEDDEEKRLIQGWTEAYCPPEVLRPKGCSGESQPATPAADVYMLGGILYQIVSQYHKKFNEVRTEISKDEFRQWRYHNKFPEVAGVSKEMREVLSRALAYKPENRYQDAEEFVDALKKYRKERRFNENKEQFAQWQARAEQDALLCSNRKKRIRPGASELGDARPLRKDEDLQKFGTAQITNGLTACVNEFASIRKEMEDEYDVQTENATSDKSLFLDVLKDELQVRSFLLERSIKAQDYGQAQALAETQANVVTQYQINVLKPDFREQFATDLQSQRRRIDKGYAKRRRDKMLACSVGILLGLIGVALILVLYQQKRLVQANEKTLLAEAEAQIKLSEERIVLERRFLEYEAKARKASNQQLFDIYQPKAQTAQDERFGQGGITFWAKLLNLKDPKTNEASFPQCYNMLDIASKTLILPQQISSFNPIVNESGFSTDGRFFVFQDLKNNFDVWDTETLQTVTSVNLAFSNETTTFIRSNPCFEDENSGDAILASRFLLVNTDGDVWLVSDQERAVKLATYFSNIRVAANEAKESENFDSKALITSEDKFKTNLVVSFEELTFTSCCVTEKDAKGSALLFVGAQTGEVLTYSLPDFKLVGAFKSQNEIVDLAASQQKKYVVIVDKKDWTCRRYAFDGTLLNEYDLDFPEADSSSPERWLRITLSPSEEKLLAGNDQGAIRVWDVEADLALVKTPNSQIEGTFTKGVKVLYWLDDERFLSLGHNNDCRVWNLNEIGSDGIPNSVTIDCGLPQSWSGVRTAAFSPKTQKMVLAGLDEKLRFVDVSTGNLVAQTRGIATSNSEVFSVLDVTYLPEKNGLILSTLSSPFDSIKLFDADSFEEIRGFNPEPDKTPKLDWFAYAKLATSIAAPSIGSEFAVALTSGEIVFFNADDSKPVHTLDAFTFGEKVKYTEAYLTDIPIVASNSTAKFLAGTTTKGNEIVLWDWKSKKEIRRWSKSKLLNEADWKKDDDEIVFDENDDQTTSIEEFDFEQDDFEINDNFLPGHTTGLCFVDDDKILEITDLQLKLWDASTGKFICSTKENFSQGYITDRFALTSDQKKIALGGLDGSVRILSTKDLKLQGSLEAPESLSNQNTMVWQEEHRKNNRTHITENVLNSLYSNQVTGVCWSHNGKLLCVAYSNGCATIFGLSSEEDGDFSAVPLASFIVNRESEFDTIVRPQGIQPFFTKDNRLITLDTNGSIQRWDYTPSKESSTTLWDLSVQKADAGNVQRQEWAGISSSLVSKKTFAIYSGTNLKYKTNNIGDFQYWTAPDGVSGYLTLHTPDGKLSFLDGESYEQVPSVIDERAGFPEKGMERIYVSPDGTKIAGIERLTFKTWVLDLSQPAAQWEQISWRDETASSFQLTFSPNSQILASVDDDVLRFWDVKKRQEISPRNGKIFKGMSTSEAGPYDSINDYGKIEFISDDLLVQTGLAKGFYIWNVKERTLFQEISVSMIGEIPRISACESLNRGEGKDKPTTFVIAGYDGILRFYQLSEQTQRFEPVYILSHLQLNVLDDLKRCFSKPYEELYAELLYDNAVLMLTAKSVSLSEDGKTLYVGSISGLRSYNMEEIWKNIDELPEKWQNVDVESLTGLRVNSSGELTPFVRNHMIRVESKE